MPSSGAARLGQLLALNITEDFNDVVIARKVVEGLPIRSVIADILTDQ
ncbi:MAG: hypothetical protein ACFB6S_15075 [Geminicoccaceae bacterium]